MRVHPAAEIFPMLGDAELGALAADIKEHGLRFPIITCDGLILDGRNRARACEIAGVKPDTTEWNGGDTSPWLYAWSVNVRRRHLDAGTQAALWLRLQDGDGAWQDERERMTAEANAKRSKAASGNANAAKENSSKNSAASNDAALKTRPSKHPQANAAAARAGGGEMTKGGGNPMTQALKRERE